MKVSLFIVTHRKDFDWLKYCVRSIRRFCTGFQETRILVPSQDHNLAIEVVGKDKDFVICSAKEWEGKGFLWHAAQIMKADEWCRDSDYIAHFDPDCVFTDHIKPSDLFKDGKAILRYEAFASLGKRTPGILKWKEAAEACLPFGVENEFMRGHPEMYHRSLYPHTRALIMAKTSMSVDAYIKNQRNEYPQTFAEFPTLGAVAYRCFRDMYFPHDCASQLNPDYQPYPVQQFWSHGAIDEPQDIWVKGSQIKVVPKEMLNDLGLL